MQVVLLYLRPETNKANFTALADIRKLMKNKAFYLFSVACLCVAVLSSCGRYNFPKETTKEDMKANPRIYGEVGGPAAHSKLTYSPGPNDAAEAAELKKLLFSDTPNEAAGVAPAATAPVAAPSEEKTPAKETAPSADTAKKHS